MKHKALLGSAAQGRAELRSITMTRYTAHGKDRQKLVEEVHASVKEQQASTAVSMW